jgi:hypothetical protein
MVVMQNMVPIHGRPTWSSKFLIATVNSSGRFSPLRFVFDDDAKPTSCYAVATDLKSGEELKGEIITMALAKSEGWLDRNGSKWKTMPGQMFRYRAASWWANVFCPEISLGLMSSEEAVDIEAVTVREVVMAPQVAAAALTPEIAAAAAPVATLTEQQQAAIHTALERQLTPVGRAAFVVDACVSFGVEALAEIPAEQHSALMHSLANAGNRERWNRGCGHADGKPVLSAEQIAELTPKTPKATEEAPQQQPAATPQRTVKPAARAAAPAASEPVQEAAADQGESGDDSDAVQAQLM